MRTGNPTLSDRVFAETKSGVLPAEERMTLDGTINRTGILVLLAVGDVAFQR